MKDDDTKLLDDRTLSDRSRGGRLTAKYDGPHPVDVYVGQRIRQRRVYLRMSQEKLGELLNVSFQQVQKYETGRNRVSASRLYTLGRILDVPTSYFFDHIEDQEDGTPPPDDDPSDPLSSRDSMELTKAYYQIQDRSVRRRLVELMRAMADEYEIRNETDID